MPRSLPRSSKFSRRLLSGAVVALLVANGGAWYQLEVRARRGPSFSQGGSFAAAASAATVEPSPTTTTSTTAPPGPATTAPAPAPSTTVIAAPANSYAP